LETIILIISLAIFIAVLLILVRIFTTGKDNAKELISRLEDALSDSGSEIRHELGQDVRSNVRDLGVMLDTSQRSSQQAQKQAIDMMSQSVSERLRQLETRFGTLEANNDRKLESMNKTIAGQLSEIREDNNRKLDEIQKTVDEKLESRMNESFKLISERLEQVYKGLGEMQSIASGVGDLKKVLSNVKSRGILGEIQLGAILAEILAPEQYDTDVEVVPKSKNRVEFAVKLPGGDGGTVYLPIDSKFPGDRYSALRDAYDSGSREAVEAAKHELRDIIRKCAKDIRDKYVSPPHTTAFGIMFLPFEGLYAEVVSSGLVEELQRDFSINIAGPSTMAALLNSLQMGFRTLAIQKRSNEVWKVLGAVKTEFTAFGKVLDETQTHLHKVEDDLEKLVGVRTRQINRRLASVEALPDEAAKDTLTDAGS